MAIPMPSLSALKYDFFMCNLSAVPRHLESMGDTQVDDDPQ